ncbi:hypothetical protein P692DRAFT_201810048 [Suillus brevipes Sb2]|nr:hypothetical protein P692DRAFT_201810048 [Suillus brevipes Sb2]
MCEPCNIPLDVDSCLRIILCNQIHRRSDPLRKNITAWQGTSSRTCKSNFRPSETLHLTPGCINIALCWFQQGHECYGPPPDDPGNGFKPMISATLKGEWSLSMIIDMQKPALIASAALRIMHPQLYWASVATHLELDH